ncbi:hypothetical protein [Desulfurococcus mucosus]|uniref:Uncharacterized protein n=1 Tax=Desulfurococcus mucosus (strain ATCC 35584 / DSM 2162 / JCM 9187 / O7/1) TaxID=765177 RepID=E8R746_DESM0|nr:hypothetical protein [Desulfurococcus mucosus]ADV65511.1 hypothetical protein Desmu_1215 [Desulfurococcus mucosus DSM 2162]
MVSTRDLVIVEKYGSLGTQRYRICVKGTNILVNVEAYSDEEALHRALEILGEIGLTDEALENVRRRVGDKARC